MYRKVINKIKKSLKKSFCVIKREFRETKKMAHIYIKERENKVLLREANKQLIDIFKILFLLPITLLPGSIIVITLLELIAKAFKCTIFPKKQKF